MDIFLNNSFLIYQYKMSLSLFVLYLIYFFFLKNETNFKLNRFYLLLSLVFSVVFPFMEFENIIQTPEILQTIILEEINIGAKIFLSEKAIFLKNLNILFFVYCFISFMFLLILLKEIYVIKKLIFQNKTYKFKKINFVILKNQLSSFSFFNYLFLSNTQNTIHEKKKIILHEKIHIKQFHSIDILLLELLKIVFWFNPLIYLYKKSLRDVHEFLADDGVLDKLNSSVEYKRLLVQDFFYNNYKIANSFKQFTIKNRLIMMTKIKSPASSKFKILFALPVLFFLISNFAFSQAKSEKLSKGEKVEEVYDLVEEMPQYVGGMQALQKFMSENIKFPKKEKKEGLQQRLYLSFVIDEKGKVIDVKVVGANPFNEKLKKFKGDVVPSKNFVNEATRVISMMPNWKAGKDKGKNVKVKMTLPIGFRLADKKK